MRIISRLPHCERPRKGAEGVCQKGLKDRKTPKYGALNYDDIDHYQKIVAALSETIRLMGKIDKVIETHGGWPIE